MTGSIEDARRALIEEREEARRRVAELDRAIASLDPLVSGSGGRRKRRQVRGAVSAGILAVLEGQDRAIHASEILAALEERGAAPQAADPKASLGSTLLRLSKQGRVRNVGRNRWRRTGQG